MVLCLLCGFEVELDDAAVLLAARPRCICIRCFDREVDSPPTPMPPRLRREVASCVQVDV